MGIRQTKIERLEIERVSVQLSGVPKFRGVAGSAAVLAGMNGGTVTGIVNTLYILHH